MHERLVGWPGVSGLLAALLAVLLVAAMAPRVDADESVSGPAVPGVVLPLHTKGRWIMDARDRRVKIASVNWYGAESSDFVVGGLDRQPLARIVRLIRRSGMNSVRLPWSNELVERNPVIDPRRLAANPLLAGKRGLEVFDAVVDELGRQRLMVILDNHRSRGDWCCDEEHGDGLWHTARYPESAWLADWRAMAARYRDRPHVIGAELRNEIRPDPGLGLKPTWGSGDRRTDWRAAAERGGNAVLAVDPDLLIIVGGLDYQADLSGVPEHPVRLGRPGRLVYAAHDYPWFHPAGDLGDDAAFAVTLRKRWAFLLEEGKPHTSPVYVSEWGGCQRPSDDRTPCDRASTVFFDTFVRWARSSDVEWAYWPLNGTQSTGYSRRHGAIENWGILNPAWNGYANRRSLRQLRTILKPATEAIRRSPAASAARNGSPGALRQQRTLR
ncbi:glycoside hydrolase family 5 protein [Actinomadura kijaniata]|uniref:glycoside hydrolase family 5 protein n=1 Tax=Actinomadura kijaniata TaxID=46161 RepID=UPI000A012B84|nr:cellulase family glycosylhydrolase [Actinomadura kijaniata]